jgi:putative MATE family efflux protein
MTSDATLRPRVAAVSGGAPPQASMLHGPVLPVLARLALPTVMVMFLVTLLSVAETYFVSSLGTDAIAAASLVVPIILLMTMVSNGGIGGGVSSAIARARGAGRMDDAQSLVWHALAIAVVCGTLFTVGLYLGAPALYRWLGGSGRSLQLAIQYSNVLFGGAIASWALMLMQAALRGAGNVKVPAMIIAGSVSAGLAISPALIMGWMGFPRLGVAGAGVAQVLTNIGALIAVVSYMRSRRSTLRLQRHPFRREHFKSILGIGLVSSMNAIMTNLTLTSITAAVGGFGISAIAGYGIASRLDSLLIPVMFGFGTAAITVVGMNLGAGNVERARRTALVNAIFVAALLEVLGLAVAIWPNAWMTWFTSDPHVLAAGARYLVIVGPVYGLGAITMELYFAGQAARKIGWPLAATALRLGCAVAAMAWAKLGTPQLDAIYLLAAAGTVVACLLTLCGFARVSWGATR